MAIDTDQFRVPPATSVDLGAMTTDATSGLTKDEGRRQLRSLRNELAECQRLLWSEQEHKLLIVLQAMDAGGKDGTIRRVFRGVNPQGVRVTSFKVPTEEELAHDYLWRVHHHTPGTGEIAVFNRSHYEDVLVVRVKDLVPEAVWRRRYDHINAFEELLADEGTTIRKFFLHISPAEQAERLQARLDDPTKHWKFRRGDLDERARWDDYMAAYTDVLERTSTDHAPWYVIPADRKWYRNVAIASVLVDTLHGLDMSWPEPEEDVSGVVIT